MITDEECREAAKELRLRSCCEGFKSCDKCKALSVRLFGDKWVLCQLDSCDANYWGALADLIDRPTCRIVYSAQLHSAFGEPIAELKIYGLSCEHQAIGSEKPGYCPKCGAVITDD